MKKIIKLVVIASMKTVLWRMKIRLFFHTKTSDNHNKNTVKIVKIGADKI